MNQTISLVAIVVVACLFHAADAAAAFMTSQPTKYTFRNRQTKASSLNMLDVGFVEPISSAISNSHFFISTIDADIANIPTNEFQTVFLGGLTVMAGGLISAIIVGTIVESGDLYANLVADSYAQQEDDEEFWKGLSDEEAKKAREIMARLKASRNDEEDSAAAPAEAPAMELNSSENINIEVQPVEPITETKKTGDKMDMFSDYDN